MVFIRVPITHFECFLLTILSLHFFAVEPARSLLPRGCNCQVFLAVSSSKCLNQRPAVAPVDTKQPARHETKSVSNSSFSAKLTDAR